MPLVVAFLASVSLTPAFARVATRTGLVDLPSHDDALKIHEEARPLSGGIAIFVALAAAMGVAREPVEPLAGASMVLLLVLGVSDDARDLPPLVRLGAQFLAGGLLLVSGVEIASLGWIGPVVIVVAVPALANAVNITDGQDGLAAGLVLIATIGIWAISAESTGGVAALGIMGALLGFLVWNRPRASVFLGDGGAYLLGGLLVVLAIEGSTAPARLLGIGVCLGVFGLELVSTMVRRIRGGTSLVSGDRRHVYDLLAVRLGSRIRSTYAMWAAGACLSVIGWAGSRGSVRVAAAAGALAITVGGLATVSLGREGVPLRRPR